MALLAGEDYDAEKFKKLSDREHVRLRYGMYIGDSSVQGLHHLVYELVNNSIDEVMAGYATEYLGHDQQRRLRAPSRTTAAAFPSSGTSKRRPKKAATCRRSKP